METTTEVKPKQDFAKLITISECKDLIRDCVVDLTAERKAVDEAPPNSTALLNAKARVAYLEAAQDRLWAWYKRLVDEQTGEA